MTKCTSCDQVIKDDLKIINASYDENHKHLFPGDYIKNAPSIIIATGTDEQIQILFDKMWARAEEINAGNYDYKLPIPGCPPSLCHIQNSNTVVSEMVKAAGLDLKLPIVNEKTIWAPGIDGDIKTTDSDPFTKKTTEKVSEAFVSIGSILESFSNPEIKNPELNNMQRFRMLSQKENDKGNSELAEQLDSVMSFLGEIKNNDQKSHQED